MSPRKSRQSLRAILAPVDFSQASRCALRTARAVAQHTGAVLHVAFVDDPLLVAAAVRMRDPAYAGKSRTELGNFVRDALGPGDQGRCALHVTAGDPAREIVKLASTNKTDLIVMGTHGLTGFRRLLLGSTTLGVLKRARTPVLAIPPKRRRG